MYSAVITKSGQVTLPKELRDFLGVKPGGRIVFNKNRDGVSIHRKLNRDEFFAKLDENKSATTRALIKKNSGKTATELKDEYLKSSIGRKEMEEKYGAN